MGVARCIFWALASISSTFCSAFVLKPPTMTSMSGKPQHYVVVGLNSAVQRTLTFSPPTGFMPGVVNRASKGVNGAGGKGQNVARRLKELQEDNLPADVKIVQFVGGQAGAAVINSLQLAGVGMISAHTAAETRTCTTLIDSRWGEVTEIVEPWSGEITAEEQSTLQSTFAAELKEMEEADIRLDGVAIMGSLPQGVQPDIYARLLDALDESPIYKTGSTRVLLDSVVGVDSVLSLGHNTLLKLNAQELLEVAGIGKDSVSLWMEESLRTAAAKLFKRYPSLAWIGATNGPLPGVLFSHLMCQGTEEGEGEKGRIGGYWRYRVPRIDVVCSTGAGDATAASTLKAWCSGLPLPDAFRIGLAAGCGSCEESLSNKVRRKELQDAIIMDMVDCANDGKCLTV